MERNVFLIVFLYQLTKDLIRIESKIPASFDFCGAEQEMRKFVKMFIQIHVMIKQITDVERAILKIDPRSLAVHFRQIK